MSYHLLTCQSEDNVAVIEIAGPVNDQEKIIQLANEFADLCAKIKSNKKIRVLVLTGNGDRSFSIAETLSERVLMTSAGPQEEFLTIAEPIANLHLPVIASINGDAIGQGLELALACDIRIATEKSHFGLPHIKRGLIPWDGGTQRLTRLVGKAKAMEMILTGETINAQEAYRIGLVNRIVPSVELTTIVSEMAREMASKGPIALRYAKEAINKGMDLTLEQGLHLEADLYYLLHTTRDRTEGIKAFREKRKYRFEGI